MYTSMRLRPTFKYFTRIAKHVGTSCKFLQTSAGKGSKLEIWGKLDGPLGFLRPCSCGQRQRESSEFACVPELEEGQEALLKLYDRLHLPRQPDYWHSLYQHFEEDLERHSAQIEAYYSAGRPVPVDVWQSLNRSLRLFDLSGVKDEDNFSTPFLSLKSSWVEYMNVRYSILSVGGLQSVEEFFSY